MVDSPEWVIAKAAGDSAEIAVAEWFRGRDFDTFKTLGYASFDLLLQATVEVKRDFLAEKTGNVAVEVSYNRQSSGIHTSPATYWAFVLSGEAILIVLANSATSSPEATSLNGLRGMVTNPSSNWCLSPH